MGRHNRPDQPITFQMAQRAPEGEGALPARVEPPALHKVKYNGLAKTPPMGGTVGTSLPVALTTQLFAGSLTRWQRTE